MKYNIITRSIAAAVVCAFASPVFAGAPGTAGDVVGAGGHTSTFSCDNQLQGNRCLIVVLDHTKRVKLNAPAHTLLVGNPAIADVTILSKDIAFISAHSVGSTNLVALDEKGEILESHEIFVRESEVNRVTMRRGMERVHYQCTPNCTRTLSDNDSSAPHKQLAERLSTANGLNEHAIGRQSGGGGGGGGGVVKGMPQ